MAGRTLSSIKSLQGILWNVKGKLETKTDNNDNNNKGEEKTKENCSSTTNRKAIRKSKVGQSKKEKTQSEFLAHMSADEGVKSGATSLAGEKAGQPGGDERRHEFQLNFL